MWSYHSISPLFFIAQAILAPIQTAFALSSFTAGIQSSSESTPIKRVGIVGTGIAGLSLAHALENVQNNNSEDFEISYGPHNNIFNFSNLQYVRYGFAIMYHAP